MTPLVLRPWSVQEALPFVGDVHRRLKRVYRGMWAVRIMQDREVVGCALVGTGARSFGKDYGTLCVARVAVREGTPNGCSMLYGACSRAARAMGAINLVTYTHLDEPGTSVRAAGWFYDGITRGGEYDRPSRARAAQIDARPKNRWWAPWSERANVAKAATVAVAAFDAAPPVTRDGGLPLEPTP